MAHPVMWFQIQGKQARPLQSFYKKVFAWKMTAGGPPMALVDAEQDGISGGIGASGDDQASVAIYVGVDDLERHLKIITRAGGEVAMPPMELPGDMGSIAAFLDPAGNWIGLWQKVTKVKKAKAGSKKSAAKKPARKVAKTAAKKPARQVAKRAAKPVAKKAPKRAR